MSEIFPPIFISSWVRQPQELPCDFGSGSMESRQPKPIADRQFEIEFLDSSVEAFAFTFG
jgi:hypothetical protein